MAKEKYQNAILQSISIVANQAVKQADYNKTIQATIIKCIDPTIEQYRVKYQDGYWYAYGNGSGVKYAEGSNVYILVPKGDMSENKIILGTVQKLGINYINPISEENKYEETGNNVVTSSSGQFGLCSYKIGGDSIILYEENGQNNKININNSALKQYIQTASHLSCAFKVRTNLNAQQKYKGKYGIKFTIVQKDATVGTASAETLKNCIIDIDLMEGNPYNFQSAIIQRVFLEINSNTFKRISKVELFSEGFPIEKEKQMPNDIFISSLAFQGMKLLSQEEMDTVALSFIARKGYIFEENTTQTSLPIQAIVRAAGQVVNDTVQNVEYYWFVKNVGITASNPYYCKEGGQGWLCINSYRTINGNVEFNPGRKSIFIPIEDAKIKENIYKCVIIYGNSKFSKEFTIINENADYDISISSDKGTEFETGLGKPTLTCIVLNKENDISNQLKYLWAVTDQLGATFILQGENTNQITYDVKDIIGFNIFSCTAIDLNNNVIGSASITLINKKTSDGGFSLIINNGKQVFSYDEQGVSPCKNKVINYIIPELSFTLYNREGQEVDLDTVDSTNITWSFVNNSVGILKNLQTDSKKLTAIYEIRDYYLAGAEGANISLEINYAGYRLSATTDFTFTKQGYSGTNGTGIVARIVPAYNNINKKMENGIFPIVYNNSKNTNFDYLTAQLWKNGEQISANNIAYAWSILKNKDDNSYISLIKNNQTPSRVTIGRIRNNGVMVNISSYQKPVSNIIQVAMSYEGKRYYATLPILTADADDKYLIYIKPGTGYSEVLYTEDGAYPSYVDNPFAFVIKDLSTDEESEISPSDIIYTYSKDGNFNNINGNENICKVQPKTTYDGYELNNFIQCQAKVGNNDIYLHIPVHQYLNRYGHAALNDWNGNSIQIDNQNNVILSPQIGAGSKDSNNTFTGILMGSVKPAGSHNKQDGLFGYAAGKQSIFLDANTGNATFGIAGNGQILMTPSSGTITGGEYSTSAKTGMQINLKEPSIKYGSGNFSVNKDGHLTAKGGGSIAGWNIKNNELSKDTVGMSSDNSSKSNIAFWAGNVKPSDAPFSVNFAGDLKSTSINIGGDVFINNGKIYSKDHPSFASTGSGFYLSSDGLSLGANFSVNKAGSLIARDGYIGNGSNGFKINPTSISNGNVYLGTDKISLGNTFSVNNTGFLTASRGKIAGWNFNDKAIYNDDVTDARYENEKGVFSNGVYFGEGGLRMGANFHVGSNGWMYATAGTIGGWTIGSSTLKGGKLTLDSGGSMSGPGWKIESGGKATFNNIHITGGDMSGGTISGGTRTGGSMTGGRLDPSKVTCGDKGTTNNMNEWCVKTLKAEEAWIKNLVANKITATFTNSFILKCGALKVGGHQFSAKKLSLPSGTIYVLATDNISYSAKPIV